MEGRLSEFHNWKSSILACVAEWLKVVTDMYSDKNLLLWDINTEPEILNVAMRDTTISNYSIACSTDEGVTA